MSEGFCSEICSNSAYKLSFINKKSIFATIFFLKRGVTSYALFNARENWNNNLLFFLHQVVIFCYIGSAIEPFFENYCYTVVILSNLDVHAELVIVTNLEILYIF